MLKELKSLETYEICPERGFLPSTDPLQKLPDAFAAWEQAAGELPKLLVSDRIRSLLERLPLLDPSALSTKAQKERAMMLLSYLGHAYVWGESAPLEELPEVIAVPWHKVAGELGRPPVLSYASYALSNWRRLDSDGPIACGNIALLQNFLGGIDEEWFIFIHVDIERQAAPAIATIPGALKAAQAGDEQGTSAALKLVGDSLDAMNRVMDRMPLHCDPYCYYNRVRPYIHGWRDNPALPAGLKYAGVGEYGGKPQFFRGETGAQSAIVPALDALLGVGHKDDPLLHYLREMRDYMPPAHRSFIEDIEAVGSLRDFAARAAKGNAELRDNYNRCVTLLGKFRTTHLDYASSYIDKQKQTSANNPTKVGTGGTPFMVYLKKHRDETDSFLIG